MISNYLENITLTEIYCYGTLLVIAVAIVLVVRQLKNEDPKD